MASFLSTFFEGARPYLDQIHQNGREAWKNSLIMVVQAEAADAAFMPGRSVIIVSDSEAQHPEHLQEKKTLLLELIQEGRFKDDDSMQLATAKQYIQNIDAALAKSASSSR